MWSGRLGFLPWPLHVKDVETSGHVLMNSCLVSAGLMHIKLNSILNLFYRNSKIFCKDGTMVDSKKNFYNSCKELAQVIILLSPLSIYISLKLGMMIGFDPTYWLW